MEITIKTLTGKTSNLIVRSNDTINEVISKIPTIKEFEIEHHTVDQLRLIFNEKQLKDHRFLSECDITQVSRNSCARWYSIFRRVRGIEHLHAI